MSDQVPSVEQEARTLGWVPVEEFKGDPARWVDADTFVERGKTIMPILKKNNQHLESLVNSQKVELERMRSMVDASQESIAELKEVHAQAMKSAIEKTRKEVMTEIKNARDAGNVELELQLTEDLADLKIQQKDLEAKEKQRQEAPSQQPHQMDPEFMQWMKDNPWFNTDMKKTMKASGIAQILRADMESGAIPSLQGRAFFDKVVAEMEGETAPKADKVGGGRPTGAGGGGGGGGKSYSDLPSDAKEVCDRQGKKLVGEGRAFKDNAAWRKYYAELYFQGN